MWDELAVESWDAAPRAVRLRAVTERDATELTDGLRCTGTSEAQWSSSSVQLLTPDSASVRR